jgi:hypothetical protein
MIFLKRYDLCPWTLTLPCKNDAHIANGRSPNSLKFLDKSHDSTQYLQLKEVFIHTKQIECLHRQSPFEDGAMPHMLS